MLLGDRGLEREKQKISQKKGSVMIVRGANKTAISTRKSVIQYLIFIWHWMVVAVDD